MEKLRFFFVQSRRESLSQLIKVKPFTTHQSKAFPNSSRQNLPQLIKIKTFGTHQEIATPDSDLEHKSEFKFEILQISSVHKSNGRYFEFATLFPI